MAEMAAVIIIIGLLSSGHICTWPPWLPAGGRYSEDRWAHLVVDEHSDSMMKDKDDEK